MPFVEGAIVPVLDVPHRIRRESDPAAPPVAIADGEIRVRGEPAHIGRRVRDHLIALAKQEVKELATGNAIAAGLMAFGALLTVLAILVAVPVLVVMLVPWKWEAAAIWVAAYLIVGLVLIVIGKARLQVKLPPRTMESLKENKEWALRRVKSNGR